jgi:hypothetical protein
MATVALRLGMIWGRLSRRPWVVPLILFFLFFALYLASGTWQRTPYVAHVYLAMAMLQGRFNILNPPGHFELVWFQGKAFLPYGVGPSLLMTPFVAYWGIDFHQAAFAAGLGALTAAIWWRVLHHFDLEPVTRRWLFVAYALGSPVWFYSGKNGATWSLMHMVTLFGLSLAFLDVYGKRRGWLTGLGLGVAMLARQNTILSGPFFLYMLLRKRDEEPIRWRGAAWYVGVASLILALNCYYNWARFGSPTDNGYARFILGKDNPPFGIFSTGYFLKNLHGYFFSLPMQDKLTIWGHEVPWLNPTYDGVNIWLSYPALLLAPFANWREKANWLALATIVMILTVYMFYYWSGWTQFGRRYFLDAWPFALVLVASGSRYLGAATLRRAAMLGVLVEIWGIWWWTAKGW